MRGAVSLASAAMAMGVLLLLAQVSSAQITGGGGGGGNGACCNGCGSKISFELDGLLDDAPIEDLQKCSLNCPGALTCDWCRYGKHIFGRMNRPGADAQKRNKESMGTYVDQTEPFGVWDVNAEQLVGYDVGIMNTSSDKIIMVDIVSAYTKAWVDGITALADSSGANELSLMNFVGDPLSSPLPSALQQLVYNVPSTNIVWSASILNVTQPAQEAALLAQLSGGLRGHWNSTTNPEFRYEGVILPVFQQGPVVDITTQPLMPLREYFGTCKTNTCSSNYNVIVPVPTIPVRPPPVRR